MKISIGYYDMNGRWLGTNVTTSVPDYYFVSGTVRKKICEHPDVSPYKRKEIKTYTRTYCDQNRLWIEIHEYKNFNKQRTIKKYSYWSYGETDANNRKHETLKSIVQHLFDSKLSDIARKFRISSQIFIYLPGYFDVNYDVFNNNLQQR